MNKEQLVKHIEGDTGIKINENDPIIIGCKKAIDDLNKIKH